MFIIELKHDSIHRVWRKLSVSTKQAKPLIDDLTEYLRQYARDNQMNFSQLSGRVLDVDSGEVVFLRLSDAIANRR